MRHVTCGEGWTPILPPSPRQTRALLLWRFQNVLETSQREELSSRGKQRHTPPITGLFNTLNTAVHTLMFTLGLHVKSFKGFSSHNPSGNRGPPILPPDHLDCRCQHDDTLCVFPSRGCCLVASGTQEGELFYTHTHTQKSVPLGLRTSAKSTSPTTTPELYLCGKPPESTPVLT